eukprot:COSAG03_NODE_1705_length_3622_cov_6.174851_2_plen_172_part_00
MVEKGSQPQKHGTLPCIACISPMWTVVTPSRVSTSRSCPGLTSHFPWRDERSHVLAPFHNSYSACDTARADRVYNWIFEGWVYQDPAAFMQRADDAFRPLKAVQQTCNGVPAHCPGVASVMARIACKGPLLLRGHCTAARERTQNRHSTQTSSTHRLSSAANHALAARTGS